MAVKNKTRTDSSDSGKSRKKHAASATRKADSRAMQLKGQLDIREANNLKAKLAKFLDANRTVVLDASKVEKVDTSIMQLLAAFCRCANAKGIEVKWKNPNSRLLHAAELLGLSNPLGLENTAQHKTD